MAEAQLFVSQDEITCSVCLETLTDPVTIPCGHSFCLNCPQCRRSFTTRHELSRNLLLNEVIRKLKKMALSSLPSKKYASSGDVECDFCIGKKFRAVKSCLTCMASFCQTHLQHHYKIAAWKGHKLTDPEGNLEEKLCAKHQKSLEMFCKTDKTCICMMCGLTEHNGHEKVELETERQEQQVSGVWCPFYQCYFLFLLVSSSLLMQTVSSRCVLPADGDSLSFTVTADFSSEDLRKELLCLKKSLEKISQWAIITLSPSGTAVFIVHYEDQNDNNRDVLCSAPSPVTHSQISSLVFFSLLSDFCPLTLDINTAHRRLHLSEGNKKVTCKRTKPEYPDHPDRFDDLYEVLCREALTGTRCYWEVECTGVFIVIGVTYKGLGRKGKGMECSLGDNEKSWSLLCFNSKYSVHHNNKQTTISAPYSPKVGVYLDWPAGLLSFYSVSHTMTLLHRFSTSFTEPLYPGFGVMDCHLLSRTGMLSCRSCTTERHYID
uniref:Tripartite motif-containing protein 16-like n=1 Tax=Erpetoichthys calabaricus TaxID=27687 RepID=A0A8C4XH82_ERPCA